jgi:quercetin dioxygenase-like cupin family protein
MSDDALADFKRRNVQKFADLKPLGVGPPDRVLERFQRDRFSVIGRPDERPDGDQGANLTTPFNIGYIRCEPGKGHCSHSHPGVEIFIPLSGRWRIEITGVGEIIADAWDAVSMPGDTFHSATNISDEPAWMMSVNDGTQTARYAIAPEVREEILRAKEAAL